MKIPENRLGADAIQSDMAVSTSVITMAWRNLGDLERPPLTGGMAQHRHSLGHVATTEIEVSSYCCSGVKHV